MKLNKKLHRIAHEGGFTLIEMLLVVGIIAIIVSIAVPAMQSAKTDAQDLKKATVLSAITMAKTRFALATGTSAANIATFNADTHAWKLTKLLPYISETTNWIELREKLMRGTGSTTLTIGNIDDPSTVADETTTPAIPQRGMDP